MRGGSLVVLALAAGATARAEVPMHNPDLDVNCTPGYQWSRDTVACEQANCPAGAGRTYTLECNCGEAWGKPTVTCRDPKTGLATHCVTIPMRCDESKNGFDPITGACKPGFVAEADGTCKPTFPEKLKCTVQDLAGAGLAGLEVGYGELNPAGSAQTYGNTQRLQSGADGTVEFPVSNRSASEISVNVRDGSKQSALKIKIEAQGECKLLLYDAGEAEQNVKDEYADLLANACLGADEIARIRAIEFDPTASGTPKFDPETNKIEGSASGPWDETGRTLFHEFGHAISDQIIDPTWGFVKGWPLVGKHAGGSHNNWVVNQYIDATGPDVDPEQLAFEESLADFLAMLHYARRGQVYQEDLANPARAMEHLQGNPGTGSRTEGVITSFLWEYYRPLIESGPDGPARALGDFIRVTRYNARTSVIHGAPARSINEFIAAAAKSAGESHPCKAGPGQTAPLTDLAGRYGFGNAPPPTVQLQPVKPTNPTEVEQLINKLGHDASRVILEPGKLFDLPAGSITGTVTRYAPDYVTSGRMMRADFLPTVDAQFGVDGDALILKKGSARVIDGAVQTPTLRVNPQGTEIVITILADGREMVVVAGGAAEVVLIAGGPPVVLRQGQAIETKAGGGLLAPRDGESDLKEWARTMAASAGIDKRKDGDASGDGSGGGTPWYLHLPWIGAIGIGAIALIIALARRRR
jgi:hypothetical protein